MIFGSLNSSSIGSHRCLCLCILAHKGKVISLVAKVSSRYFHWFPAAMLLGYLQSVVGLSSGLLKTNPASGREEDLDPGPPDYKSVALTTRPRRLPNNGNVVI